MEFRNLKRQYEHNKELIDAAIADVIDSSTFIGGAIVAELEKKLAEYVGVKHCITCANGTDALQLALMAWKIKEGDAVFVPDFTFFSTGETVATVGAQPIFVDVDKDTFNLDPYKLDMMIKEVIDKGEYTPKVIVAVDLFGRPADYEQIELVAKKYGLLLLEDGAQGFGGSIGEKKACSFGDIATTSFFPAKPLGCYGDGGAIFTDNDEWAALIGSYKVHGKGCSKYDNERIGMNSRLDSIQAAVLNAKFDVFNNYELDKCEQMAEYYSEQLREIVKVPTTKQNYNSSWAQYTICLKNKKERDSLSSCLKKHEIPAMVYYQKPMHKQKAFDNALYNDNAYAITNELCDTVLSLPFGPYLLVEEADEVVRVIKNFMEGK